MRLEGFRHRQHVLERKLSQNSRIQQPQLFQNGRGSARPETYPIRETDAPLGSAWLGFTRLPLAWLRCASAVLSDTNLRTPIMTE